MRCREETWSCDPQTTTPTYHVTDFSARHLPLLSDGDSASPTGPGHRHVSARVRWSVASQPSHLWPRLLAPGSSAEAQPVRAQGRWSGDGCLGLSWNHPLGWFGGLIGLIPFSCDGYVGIVEKPPSAVSIPPATHFLSHPILLHWAKLLVSGTCPRKGRAPRAKQNIAMPLQTFRNDQTRGQLLRG